MMLITRVLKKTTGEDNEKTEMYAYDAQVYFLACSNQSQVHDSKSNSSNRSHCIGCDIGQYSVAALDAFLTIAVLALVDSPAGLIVRRI